MPSSTAQSSPLHLLPELIPIEGGTFEMGSNEYDREQPIHRVQVSSFHLGKYPVTNAQYAHFLNAYGSFEVQTGVNQGQRMIYEHHWEVQHTSGQWQAAEGFEKHPVVYVTWYGAVTYCQWLSEQTGDRYRLSSESEWEYAAKGGSYNNDFRYSGSNHLDEVGWYRENSYGQTKPVGLKYPNALGVYDMSGNVDEWCADHWHGDYKRVPIDGSAWIGRWDSIYRVIRGGSWNRSDIVCRVSYRHWNDANFRSGNLGFRVIRY